MLASIGDDYFLTDRSWKCTARFYPGWYLKNFNDASWPAAVFVQPNSPSNRWHHRRPEISADAIWIWTRNFRSPIDSVVYCRGRLRMFKIYIEVRISYRQFMTQLCANNLPHIVMGIEPANRPIRCLLIALAYTERLIVISTHLRTVQISSGPIRKCFMIITLISMASETVVYCSIM